MRDTFSWTIQCPLCKKFTTLELPFEGFLEWKAGTNIQEAMPEVPAEVREQLISGICPSCWDIMFPEENDEDNNDEELIDYEMGFDPYLGCYTDDV